MPSGRHPVAVTVAIMLLVELLLCAAVSGWLLDSRSREQRSAEANAQHIAALSELAITLTVQGVDKALGAMAAELAECTPQSLPCRSTDRILSSWSQHSAQAQAFFLADADGVIRHAYFHRTDLHSTQSDISDRRYFQDLRDGHEPDLSISGPQVGRVTGRLALNLARAVRTKDGRFLGVVIASLDMEQINAVLNVASVGEKGAIALRDRNMAVIARLPAGAPGNAVISDDLKTLHAQGRTEAIYHAVVPLDGTTRTIAYRKSSAYPLYLVVGLAQEDYLVRWREQLRLAIIGLAVLTVLLLVAGTALIRLTVARKQEVTRRRAAQAETLAALNKTEAILNNASDGIHLLDVRGHLLECNDRFCQMLGYSREELLGRCVTQWDAGFNPDTLISQTLRELFKVTGARVLETRHRRRDGVVFDVEITFNTFELDGQPCLFAASRDISERKRARERLQLAASVFSHAHEGIMITDPQGIILEVNKSFTRITGYEHDEVIGQSPRILKSNRHPPQYHEALWHDLLTKGHWYGETWNRRKDGSNYVEMLNITAVKDDEGALQCYVGLFSDITAFKEHQKQLEHIAHHDALTNLPNRVLLNDRLQQAMHQTQRHKRAMAVVFLDLDGFKAVNDEHGHEAGDRLLIAVGHRLQTELREGDTLARVGGDEFVAVLSDLESPEECENVLERMLHAAARPVAMNDLSLQVTASIGATVYPQDPSDPEQLMRHADQAMYQAKQEGRNRYRLFDLVHDSALRSRREGMDSIRRALVHGELRLFHQPKVDMHTGQLIGTEALIRWQKPDGPLVLPGEFIPVLEDHPLAVEVGEWVIRTALAQMAQWHAQGLDVPVSVNVGSRQLQEPDFLERLRVLLAEQPTLPRGLLSLEILETSALEDISRTSGLMESCRELGVNFALDDFGTGYSSLAYLKLLPVSCLKIDQSFVIHLTSAPENRSIVDGIMGLARAFGREVIAEGVETVEHARQLLKLGCYRMQGFGIARPMPADELPAWATQWPQRTEWLALCDSA